jgi:putative photosynthetic complex assembly protein 2
MLQQVAPIVYVLFAWWFSTGVILYLVGRPRHTHKWTMSAATVLLVVAFVEIAHSAADTGHAAAYVGFTAALVVWAWQEVAFLLGYVTGPRRLPCPVQATGWARARLAFQTIQHHEVALLALGLAIVALTWHQPNRGALATFAILWTMRQSAKLNLFLGVRNLSEQFLPVHLHYLHSYFRRRRMNGLFPWSVIAATIASILSWQWALAGDLSVAGEAAAMLAATLLSLGLLEHWFMVIPLPSHALWNWGLRSRD